MAIGSPEIAYNINLGAYREGIVSCTVSINRVEVYSIRYTDFIMPMVKAMQEQQVLIDELRKANEELRATNDQRLTQNEKQLLELQRIVNDLYIVLITHDSRLTI